MKYFFSQNQPNFRIFVKNRQSALCVRKTCVIFIKRELFHKFQLIWWKMLLYINKNRILTHLIISRLSSCQVTFGDTSTFNNITFAVMPGNLSFSSNHNHARSYLKFQDEELNLPSLYLIAQLPFTL